ncbi:MAG TPA: transcriptional repressor [Actinobacteria bacterium]|nr:transcriptional repressor [Actinomycetota bacterium]
MTAETLIAALRERGWRITAARLAVCRVVAELHAEHLTAPGIAASLAGEVDQSTVYRTLEALEESGILSHTHLGHGPAVYHLADEDRHQHLICEVCGEVTELDAAVVGEALQAITRATGFFPDASHFALSGRCRRCTG